MTKLKKIKHSKHIIFKVFTIQRITVMVVAGSFLGLLFLASAIAAPTVQDGPVVKTPLGSVMGRHMKSYEGRVITAFEGIPYAKPPVGDLRFQEPKPNEPWTEVLLANTTYICMQFTPIVMTQGIMGEEDCLYLYIYVPKKEITGTENLNVVVHIHGGAFMLGAPKYLCGPDYMMDKDVVFVSFNYRLGILGFLSTEDEVVPGNNGLKDQVMALKWIKQNIQHFGGNPDSITITGLSAGGASVQYHYLSPLSKGLFHRGFSQSGTALNMWALTEQPLEKAKRLSSFLNCTTENSRQMIECLRKRPEKEIILSLTKMLVFINAVPFTPFGPVVEKGPNAFLPDHPYKLLLDGKINDYPWVVSNTKDEGIYPVGFFILYRKLQELDQRWNELIPAALDYNDTTDLADRTMIAQKVRERYLNNETLTMDNIQKLIDLFTDRLFLIDGEQAIRLHAKASKSPVYYYFFDYKLAMKTVFSGKVSGAAHSDDGRLLYRIFANAEVLPDSDKQMKNIFTDFLYSFATESKPNFKGLEWKPVNSSEEINYMHVGSPEDIQMKTIKELGPTAFWDAFPIKENQHLYKT